MKYILFKTTYPNFKISVLVVGFAAFLGGRKKGCVLYGGRRKELSWPPVLTKTGFLSIINLTSVGLRRCLR